MWISPIVTLLWESYQLHWQPCKMWSTSIWTTQSWRQFAMTCSLIDWTLARQRQTTWKSQQSCSHRVCYGLGIELDISLLQNLHLSAEPASMTPSIIVEGSNEGEPFQLQQGPCSTVGYQQWTNCMQSIHWKGATRTRWVLLLTCWLVCKHRLPPSWCIPSWSYILQVLWGRSPRN